jgi:hypothetical protein
MILSNLKPSQLHHLTTIENVTFVQSDNVRINPDYSKVFPDELEFYNELVDICGHISEESVYSYPMYQVNHLITHSFCTLHTLLTLREKGVSISILYNNKLITLWIP